MQTLLPSRICQTDSSAQLLWCLKTGRSPTHLERNCCCQWLLNMFTHTMLNRSWLNGSSNKVNLGCSDFYQNTTLTLFVFCRPWISVSWRAAKQRLEQQIKGKAKVNSGDKDAATNAVNRNFCSGGKKILLARRRWEAHSQRLQCFSWGEMSRVVSQFIPWTNEIFWGLFNFPLIGAKRRRGWGGPPSRGLRLFYSVLSKNWQCFNIAGKVKVTKQGVFSQLLGYVRI